MQVSVEALEGLERLLKLEIPADQIDGEVQKRVVDTAKRARIDGFRPGKVPRKVIVQRFGDSIRAEVVGEVANRSFQEAINQEKLQPVGTPAIDIETDEAGKDLRFTAKFEVFPEVKLGDPSTLTIEKLNASVVDKDIDNMFDKLRDQRAEWSAVDRVAADGDKLNIDFEGFRDGEQFEGGSAKEQDLELGSGQMIPGFESGLVGAKSGDTRELNLSFPDDYHAEELKGAAVKFNVTVNAVNEKSLPALDKEFFKLFEVDGDLDAFKANVRENMEKQLQEAIDAGLKKSVMDGLIEQNPVDLPAALIEQEVNSMRMQSIQRFGANVDDFDMSLLPDEMFEEQAKHRVSLGVILNQFVQDHEIKPEREQLIEFIDDIASSYDDPDEVRNMYLSNEDHLRQVSMIVTEKLVVEKIESVASVTEKTVDYDTAMESHQASQ